MTTYIVLTNALLKFEIEADSHESVADNRGQVSEVVFYKHTPAASGNGVTSEGIASFYDVHALWIKSEPVRLVVEDDE
jgi:hypothetical protein